MCRGATFRTTDNIEFFDRHQVFWSVCVFQLSIIPTDDVIDKIKSCVELEPCLWWVLWGCCFRDSSSRKTFWATFPNGNQSLIYFLLLIRIYFLLLWRLHRIHFYLVCWTFIWWPTHVSWQVDAVGRCSSVDSSLNNIFENWVQFAISTEKPLILKRDLKRHFSQLMMLLFLFIPVKYLAHLLHKLVYLILRKQLILLVLINVLKFTSRISVRLWGQTRTDRKLYYISNLCYQNETYWVVCIR